MKRALKVVKSLFRHLLYFFLVNKKGEIRLTRILSKKCENILIMQSSSKRWIRDDGDYLLRLNYPKIGENNLVFDVGGYKGQFASDLYSKYNCLIYIFEPIKEFYKIIEERFNKNKRIAVFPFGLGGNSEVQKIYHHDNGSSIYRPSGQFENIQIQSISEFLIRNDIQKVALIKINIEGSEYDLLEDLIKNNLVRRFENIQVQFHPDINNSWERMNTIKLTLCKTHKITYSYDFIWDNYELS